MSFLAALNLVNLLINNGLVDTECGRVYVYWEDLEDLPVGWYLLEKEMLAAVLMDDVPGQLYIQSELKSRGLVEVCSSDS